MDKKEVIHGLSSKEDALASKKSIIHRFNVPVSVVSEPKPECDHIVGLRNIFHINGGVQRGFIEVHRSDINGLMMLEYAFKECPECGEKLNLKKDE